MKRYFARGIRRVALGTLALAVLPMVQGCQGITDTLLEGTTPDLISPENTQSPDGALALYNGALKRLRDATAGGTTAGNESTWLLGGLLTDEWSTSSTFVENDESDQRTIREENGTVTFEFRTLSRLRTSSTQAIAALKTYRPTEPALAAEMYLARGFAEFQMASDFCNGIPLSDGTGLQIKYGSPLTGAEVFQVAIASLDSALALATGTDAQSVLVSRAARIIKARAQLGLGQFAAAGLTMAGSSPADSIPTKFSYDITFKVGSGDNALWSQGASAGRYTVGDSVEGNSRTILVKNAIPFFSAQDPRLPVKYTVTKNAKDSTVSDTTKGQDGKTLLRSTTLYARSTSVPLASGVDARLIEAEVKLKDGDAPGMLQILNDLRRTPPKLGEIQPAAMAALIDPGTFDAQVDLLFREKAFWTFSRGQRLGDLRRLVRQYNRTPENTFPVGNHYKGGQYGVDMNLPVPYAERNNPNFHGCLDRKA